MEGKKISFGFMKTKKPEKLIVEEKKDLIECVEEKAIKVIGGEEIKENTPLVIPLKPNTLITAERLKEIAEKVESALEEPEIVEKPASPQEKLPNNETLDEMAVRELLQDAKEDVNKETSALTVPLPAKPVNEGEKESTLDDYEAVPVQDFGLAMLRGMGWAPNKEKSTYKQPQLRPKGLGLGADKVVKGNQKQKSAKDSKGEDLTIVKNAHVKITSGKYSGYYGKIVSLDEDNGRVMVDIAVKKEVVSLSEFMMQPVNKSEYDKESKVINAGSYEDYKKKQTSQKSSRNTEKDAPEKNDRDKIRENKYSEREATSSRSGENKYGRDEKTSRNVESKNDRDEKSTRNVESKYDRDEKSTRNVETDKSTKNGKGYKEDDRRERDRDRSHRQQGRDSTEERSSRKKNKRYSSDESLDSLSDTERKSKKDKRQSSIGSSSESDRDRKKKSKKKERRRHDSSGSESDHRSKRNKTPEGKRDIDKKRKGKKKKRDRDRSPNYRKHRK